MYGPFHCSLGIMNILLKIPSYSAGQPHKYSLPWDTPRTLLLMFIGLFLEGVIQSCGHVYLDSSIT